MKKIIQIGSAKGFMGKYLVRVLFFQQGYCIYEYIKKSRGKELEFIVDNVDFIFHLGGKINPKIVVVSFFEKNVTLTQKTISLLAHTRFKIPAYFVQKGQI